MSTSPAPPPTSARCRTSSLAASAAGDGASLRRAGPARRRALRSATLALAAAVLSVAAPPSSSALQRSAWQAPVPVGPGPVRPFQAPAHVYGPGHHGADLGAAPGGVVVAAGAGTVTFAGPVAGRPVVVVAHDGGLRTTYEPVVPGVAVGETVLAGDPLGRLAAQGSHCAPGTCLHWGLRRGGVYLDPMLLLRRGPARLLPLHGGATLAPAAPGARSYLSQGPRLWRAVPGRRGLLV